MELDQADIQQLRYLNNQYEQVTKDLNAAILELGETKAKVQILDAKVKNLMNSQTLVLENIRCEKKIFDANRR